MIRTHAEMRAYLATVIRDKSSDASSLITDSLNLALSTIYNAYPWSWKMRKTTFSTVVGQEDYRMDEEVDQIMIMRQRTNPRVLIYVPDRDFYRLVPNPEDRGQGVQRVYREWEETGFTASLAVADTIQVVSSSALDGSAFNIRVWGHDANGIVIAETLTLNGTTLVTSINTFQSATLLRISKSANTTGVITITRTTDASVLTRIAPTEASPRSKIISFYPIPSSVITIYLEYLERLQLLVADTDVPQQDPEWNWVVMEGALQYLWAYKEQPAMAAAAQGAFLQGLNAMKQADGPARYDYIPSLEPRRHRPQIGIYRYSDSVNNAYPSYGVG